MTATAPPLIGAAVEFFPARGDAHIGIRPAMIEEIDDEEAETITLAVYDRFGNGSLRTGVMPECNWLMRAALDPDFDSDGTPYWAWSED